MKCKRTPAIDLGPPKLHVHKDAHMHAPYTVYTSIYHIPCSLPCMLVPCMHARTHALMYAPRMRTGLLLSALFVASLIALYI